MSEDRFHIRDVSTEEHTRFELHVNDFRAATLQREHGLVKLNWEIHGPMQWPEARIVLVGLLHLSVTADYLYHTKEPERVSSHRSRTKNRARG